MIREQLVKYRLKGYMRIDHKNLRMEELVQCVLVAVDFDNNTMTLCPIDINYFENENFVSSIDYCFLPPKESKLKII